MSNDVAFDKGVYKTDDDGVEEGDDEKHNFAQFDKITRFDIPLHQYERINTI